MKIYIRICVITILFFLILSPINASYYKYDNMNYNDIDLYKTVYDIPHAVNIMETRDISNNKNFWIKYGTHLEKNKMIEATCVAIGNICNIYVDNTELFGGNGLITVSDVIEILYQFETNIHPLCTNLFNTLPEYNGENKINILLTDINEGWVPGGGWYKGYFDPMNYNTTYPYTNNTHLIVVDIYPTIHYPCDPAIHDVNEGIKSLTHQYQHMLHYWVDDTEYEWVNEGLSLISEYITMGAIPSTEISYYLAFHSVNIEKWYSYDIDIKENMGASFLFMLYIYENYGQEKAISSIFNSNLKGRESINDYLLTMNTTFDIVFTEWILSLVLDDNTIVFPHSNSKAGYDAINIPSIDTLNTEIFSYNWDYGPYLIHDYNEIYLQINNNDFYHSDSQQQLDPNYYFYTFDNIVGTFYFDFIGNKSINTILNSNLYEDINLAWHVFIIGIPFNTPTKANDIYRLYVNKETGKGTISIPGLGTYYKEFIIISSFISDMDIDITVPYKHFGYCIKNKTTNESNYPLYCNILNELLEKYNLLMGEKFLYEDDILYEDLKDINHYIINSSLGINWIYKVGQLLNAIRIIDEIISNTNGR